MVLMSVSGFCRNCLTKWLTLSSRSLPNTAHLPLDFFANYVYDEDPKAWKEKYNGTPSEDLKSNYEASKSIHAKFDKKALEPSPPPNPLQSDVCCKDVDDLCAPKPSSSSSTSSSSPSVIPLPPPPSSSSTQTPVKITVALIIVSDRLHNNQYPEGDKCLPAVSRCLSKFKDASLLDKPAVVPDEEEVITSTLREAVEALKSNPEGKSVVLTCGGTGFSPRDVTPEATLSLDLDKRFSQLMSHSTRLASKDDVMASLSRGVCGEKDGIFVGNLPGNPEAVEAVLNELFKGVIWWASDSE
ncbi:hypothetical protein TrVE_jg6634 [Triparma verrucosa]|uniref:MoaB/Mog domain-containing protein n=1 Tax=Triparma verrucosa TaxID=1606542 RepID=A0A9W7BU72_9STRA|nr:hypothetical protein TrVE_jg6634 [Triparma verrucosa]